MSTLARALACGLLACAGCSGLIYKHTTEPLDTNLKDTPVFQNGRQGDVKSLRYYVAVDWDSNGIGDIAKRYGMKKVHYADLTTLSVLGIWTQRFVTVYGE